MSDREQNERCKVIAAVLNRAAKKSNTFDEVDDITRGIDSTGALFTIMKNGHCYHVRVHEYY